MDRLSNFALLALVASLFLLFGCGHGSRRAEVVESEVEEEQKDSIPPMGFWPDSLEMVEGTVRSGEAFTSFLQRAGVGPAEARAIAQACDTVFDVRKLRAGNKFRAYYSTAQTSSGPSGETFPPAVTTDPSQPDYTGPDQAEGKGKRTLEYVVYDNDKVSMSIFKCTPPFTVTTLTKPVETELAVGDVTITSSLWNDMLAAGVSPLLIGSLSDIYAWTVDFFGLQGGDRFRVLYQQDRCEGEVVAVDSVFYAEFIRDDKVLRSICFDQGDGGNLYWNEKGESLRKAFLKAPLKFTRISSGFSYNRRHPVTGKVRAHTAVDYAAPTGTPVMSIGDGTVLSAGWSGGGGNTVKIRHNSVYTTAYLHLSRYAKGIKAGARVRQGEVIGYVGSTGVSTGPHLDFRVWKNGSAINPLKLEAPPTEPIDPKFLPALDSAATRYSRMLDSLTTKIPHHE